MSALKLLAYILLFIVSEGYSLISTSQNNNNK